VNTEAQEIETRQAGSQPPEHLLCCSINRPPPPAAVPCFTECSRRVACLRRARRCRSWT
jgi:hypothetical protein